MEDIIKRQIISILRITIALMFGVWIISPNMADAELHLTGLITMPVSGPTSVAVGELDDNGAQDLVVTYEGYEGNGGVSVLLGNGDGTFRNAVNYPTGDSSNSIATGDLDDDGDLDLAVSGGHISILLGNGDGTFQTPVIYAALYDPGSIAVDDLNDDGDLDLAVADGWWDFNYNDWPPEARYNGGISVFLGNGDGTFQNPVNYATGLLQNTSSRIRAQFDSCK